MPCLIKHMIGIILELIPFQKLDKLTLEINLGTILLLSSSIVLSLKQMILKLKVYML